MEIGEHRSLQRHVGIAEVVVANAVVDGELAIGLPRIFGEDAESGRLVPVVARRGLAGHRIIGQAGFGVRVVVDQVDHVLEVEIGLPICSREQSYVVATPNFESALEAMRTNDLGQHVAPVIGVLNVIPFRKAIAPAGAQLIHIHDGTVNRPVLGENPSMRLYPKIASFNMYRRERVGLVHLQREDIKRIGSLEVRANRGTAAGDGVAEEVAVDAVLAEVLIKPDVVLLGVVVAGRVEVPVVEHRRGARDVVVGRRQVARAAPACGLGALGKNIAPQLPGGGRHAGGGCAAGLVLRHQLHFRTVGPDRLARRRKMPDLHTSRDSRRSKPWRGMARIRRRRRTAFCGMHRAAQRERHVRGVIGIQLLRLRHAEFAARGKLLRRVIEAGRRHGTRWFPTYWSSRVWIELARP